MTLFVLSGCSFGPNIGDKWVSPKDGMTLVFVPAGEFIMGSNYYGINEKPAHKVYLDAYWIDQFEVSNDLYASCVADEKCKSPISDFIHNYPVAPPSWEDAKAYCEWAGRRLPTEAEWEKAARGFDSRIYPWGNEIDCSYANFFPAGDACIGHTVEIGIYNDGISTYEVYDMAGNVSEWVSDWYDNNYYESSPYKNPAGPSSGLFHVMKGGSFIDGPDYLRSSNREEGNPILFSFHRGVVGFRCAMSE